MLKLLDRQMIRGFFKAYFVCLVSLLSLYIVVDIFTNLDDFTHHHKGILTVLTQIAQYYSYKLAQIFDRLCEAIVLLAAMFTVAWMQRCNEQVPYLSAGVSTRRIVTPVLFCAAFMLSLAVLNQEFVIPAIGDRLWYDKDDPRGEKETMIQGRSYESNGILVTGEKANRKNRTISNFEATLPENLAGHPVVLRAKEAQYVPGQGARKGGWEMTETTAIGAATTDLEAVGDGGKVLEVIDSGRYFLHTREVDFDAMTRNPNWFLLASTWRLYEELERPDSARQAPMAVLFHMRLTRPLLGLLLVVMGLSVILRDQNRNVIISAGLCVVLCGAFFAAQYCCKMLGDYDVLSPALAAWAPVLCFGPHALVLFDAIHT